MTGESMLPQDVFVQLAKHFPRFHQIFNWSLVYSCLQHGTSYNTMLRQCAFKSPLLLVVKEYKGKLFGAFLVEEI